MRILFTCVPGMAHLNAMIPLVRAAVERGHEVAVATAATFGARFAEAGVPVLPAGVDWSQSDTSSLPAFHQRRGPQLGAFAEVAGMGMVEDLLVHAKAFDPDVIVWDAMEFGGWVAGEVLGIPTAAVASAMGTPRPIMRAMAGDTLAELPTRYGLEPDPELHRLFSHLYLHRKPRTLDLPYAEPLAKEFRFRPAMFDKAPMSVEKSDEPPLVHLSLGTTFVNTPNALTANRAVIEALAEEPIRLLVSIGRSGDPEDFGTVPANTELSPYVDHPTVLPRCAAFINHGSFSSVLVAIASGVPLCFLPMAADQLVTSMHLANLGLGVNLANVHTPPAPSVNAEALRGEDIRAAVRAVLDQPKYAEAARYVAQDFRKLPPLAAVVDRLEKLAVE